MPRHPRVSAADATIRKPRPPWDLPIFVHLILDEYIGIEGYSCRRPAWKRNARTFVRDFFEKYGFRLFGNAYSRYAEYV